MKAKELYDLEVVELEERIREEQVELQELEFRHAIADIPNPLVLRHKRRMIARLKTVLNAKTAA